MRIILILILVLGGSAASAQEWIQYGSKADLFAVNFPGEPKVEDIAYTTEFGIALPARVYRADSGSSHYIVTVVDYADAEKIHTDRAAKCRAAGGQSDACQNDWRSDVQGSMVFAASKFLKRDAKLNFFGWAVVDQVEGLRVQITSNADGSKTFGEIHRHGTRLYVLEATVPARAPVPGLFQQSLMFIDEEGRSIRYRSFYTTGYSDGWKFPAPAPPRAGGPPPPPAQK